MENIYQKMQELAPAKNPIFTAVSRLTNPDEIKAFVKDCVEEYRKQFEAEKSRDNPESIVKANLGYILGYYNKETAETWMKTIEGIVHPVYGNNIPYGKHIPIMYRN